MPSREQMLTLLARELEQSELAHIMGCNDPHCAKCADNTPPTIKARRMLDG